MNICFLSREYPPETHAGGIGTYTYNMALALTRLGHSVHVITSTQAQNHTIQDQGVWVHRLNTRSIRPKELALLHYSYLSAKKISQVACEFDIVQSSEFESEAFWFAFKKKHPLITRLATPFFLIEDLNGKVFFGPRPLFNWMEKKQTLNSDAIFTSTTALADVVSQKWGIERSRVEIIPNSVDVSRVVRLGKNMPAPEMLQNRDYLLYFGRLEERKGVCIVAQALSSVFQRVPSISMVFVGSDLGYRGSSMADYIKRELNPYLDRLIFIDNLPQEELFPIVKSAKMVIIPSLWEAFGFVCIEAMALGRPVIATSGSGFEEIIEDNVSGFLVEPGNSEVLSQKILSVMKDEASLLRISAAARKRAQDFEVSKVAHKLIVYYHKVTERWLTEYRN